MSIKGLLSDENWFEVTQKASPIYFSSLDHHFHEVIEHLLTRFGGQPDVEKTLRNLRFQIYDSSKYGGFTIEDEGQETVFVSSSTFLIHDLFSAFILFTFDRGFDAKLVERLIEIIDGIENGAFSVRDLQGVVANFLKTMELGNGRQIIMFHSADVRGKSIYTHDLASIFSKILLMHEIVHSLEDKILRNPMAQAGFDAYCLNHPHYSREQCMEMRIDLEVAHHLHSLVFEGESSHWGIEIFGQLDFMAGCHVFLQSLAWRFGSQRRPLKHVKHPSEGDRLGKMLFEHTGSGWGFTDDYGSANFMPDWFKPVFSRWAVDFCCFVNDLEPPHRPTGLSRSN